MPRVPRMLSSAPSSALPVESLLALLDEVKGDLLVVGNRGLNTLTGRLLGSVPSDAARKATSDVLIVAHRSLNYRQ